MPERTVLTQISPRTWEHPADRAALNTLRALPGFDEVVRKVAGAIGERGVRHLFTANAVRVGPRQRPALDALLDDVVQSLDWADRPQLYVTQTPVVNAAAVGFEHPFIVINSGMLDVLDRDEQRFVVAHELGHIMSGHATYRTIAIIILAFGIGNLPTLAALGLLPFQLALLEWYRKSELSSDRAGLLGIQEPTVAMRAFLKLAGGKEYGDQIDLDEFMRQAAEYETEGNAWDTFLKTLNTLFRDHPFNTVRAGELQRWIESGRYASILAGDYMRRGEEKQPLGEDYAQAADHYGVRVKEALDEVGAMMDRARQAFGDAFRNPRA